MGISHSLHGLWNPLPDSTVEELAQLMELDPGTRVLDIACGAGEMIVRWARDHGVSAVGVDCSRFALAQARSRRDAVAETAGELDVAFVETRGEEFETNESFDVVSMIGASWVWGGYRNSLRALKAFVRPGGFIAFAEPFWKCEPDPAYLEAAGIKRDEFHTLPELLEIAIEESLRPLTLLGSSETDWDRYETRQLAAVDRWMRVNPEHPDRDEVWEETLKSVRLHLRWGRHTFGDAALLFRAPEDAASS